MGISNQHILVGFHDKVLAFLLVMIFAFSACGAAYGQVINANPDNYRALLTSLQAGDTLLLEAGTYEHGLQITNLDGAPGNPVVITGPDTGEPAIFLGSQDQAWNTVQINNSSYLTIQHLKLDGLDVPYIDAVNAGGITHHISLEHLEIVGHGGHQLTVGIATRGPAWDWVIRNCKVIGAGTGMYLGNWQGNNWPFVGGLIEHNLFVDTIGYNVQIKQMNSRSYESGESIPGMPLEDRKTIIRHNVFSKANQASAPTEGARPNLLVGHFPLTGPGSNDVYEIYGNFFYENTTEALFQGEGSIAFYNNVMVNSSGSAVHIQAHNNVPRNIHVFQNTIVATGNGIKVQDSDVDFTQLIVGNAVFAGTPVSADSHVVQVNNITDTYAAADEYLVNPSGDLGLGELDLFPLAGTLLSAAMDLTSLQGFTDRDIDFNSNSRNGTFRGAYTGEENNNGWTLALDIMPSPDPMPTLHAPKITFQPVSQIVQEGEAVMFSIVAAGSAPLLFQWRQNGIAIPGATTSSYSIELPSLHDNGTVFDCVVTNPMGEVISDSAILTVLGDSIAPNVISISAINATSVLVVFNEPVEQSSAETVTNYSLNQGKEIIAAVLDEDAESVRLTVSELEEDTTYTLTLSNVRDRAVIPNTIADMSSHMFDYNVTEEFTDGDADGWEPVTPSRWSIVMDEGDYAYFLNTTNYEGLSGDRLGEFSLLPNLYSNFVLTLNARIGDLVGTNGQADFAIVFGYQDVNNYYYMMFNNDAGFTALFRVKEGVRQEMASAGQDWIVDNLYHVVEIHRNSGEISVLFDDATVLTAMDTTFATGKVGVGSFNDSAYFDNIHVAESNVGNNMDNVTEGSGGGSFGPLVSILLLILALGSVRCRHNIY